MTSLPKKMKVSLLDYGAGNVRSVRNAISANGYEIEDITSPEQILKAEVLIFPGVGSYGTAMTVLHEKGYAEPLREYLSQQDRPFLGICLGMQTLFESSDEQSSSAAAAAAAAAASEPIPGLGIIPGRVMKFDETRMAVPHIGWNGRTLHQESPVLQYVTEEEDTYFVHSYYAPMTAENEDWILTSTTYGDQRFISSVQRGAVVATQFHPEKSGVTGLHVMKGFLQSVQDGTLLARSNGTFATKRLVPDLTIPTQLTKRIVVALDVRTNDDGDLVVTKGDQYDVRESTTESTHGSDGTATTTPTGRGGVRNLGKPVALASRYYQEGADEIAFLNITSFRQGVIDDMPMLQVLEQASRSIFVPLTVGGGIRSYTDPTTNTTYSALEVAARYFRAGADKVSMGSDAVYAAEAFCASGGVLTGTSSIESISRVYGVQAVVISLDPKRVYVMSPDDVTNPNHVVVELTDSSRGPNGEAYCWYQCTVRGGREDRDICAVTVAKAAEALGAGEIMLNCIDMDGQCQGYDHPLMKAVSGAVTIPVIASSGAGNEQHFVDVFEETKVQAALAAGMFHRKEVEIESVKDHMRKHGIPARRGPKANEYLK